MHKKFLAPAVAVLLALLLVGTAVPAEAKRGGGHGYSGGHSRSFSARSFQAPRLHNHSSAKIYRHVGKPHFVYKNYGHKHVNRHRPHFYVGVPLAAYSAYSYGDSCYWLRRNAVSSGSPYWWDRYYACLDGYYYD